MKREKVEWIILITNDYKKSRDFYKDILEFSIDREVLKDEFCQFRLRNCLLAIYGKNHVEKLIGKKHVGTSGGAIYSFSECNNVDEEYRRLKKKGVTFIQEPTTKSWGQRTAYFIDPDGHIWEIQQWIRTN